jgi:hypothetical protein
MDFSAHGLYHKEQGGKEDLFTKSKREQEEKRGTQFAGYTPLSFPWRREPSLVISTY